MPPHRFLTILASARLAEVRIYKMAAFSMIMRRDLMYGFHLLSYVTVYLHQNAGRNHTDNLKLISPSKICQSSNTFERQREICVAFVLHNE
jgi:hypothetical protein